MNSVERDALWISRCGINLSGPGSKQLLHRCPTDSSISACYESPIFIDEPP
jgi:hypothetical protein